MLRLQERRKAHPQFSDSYVGSTHRFYGVPVPARRALLKAWLKESGGSSAREIRAVADSLFLGASHEEKTMGAYLLGYRKDVRAIIAMRDLDRWLDQLVGWAEIDALCQNIFSADEMRANWDAWQHFLIKLSKDTNVNKRRASLVFLTGATAKSDDTRLHTLAYENIEHLRHEKDILITKAISWLLRCMVDTRKSDVAQFLDRHTDLLPKIAVRETHRKLETGKKNR